MLTKNLIKLFKRDLTKLKEEIQLYNKESNLWITDKLVSNSAGNLALHLVGNLNHFIGTALGNTGYVRQRDLEFSLKNISVEELIKQINDTIMVVENTLSSLTQSDLDKEYEKNPFKEKMTTEYFLLHLSMHLAYHLGQINYHRRLLD
ncbi:MAG: DinB superfamily protein [Winogradskyella sp.]|uniref:DinB family protein n=1 Tax=Winogradskyella poriferorum TaxID=307627 RepID=A0ABU7W6C1_9FLAO|nr:DinB superfamily protein [Winogradskyella sp.]|tara:strand:- start:625 stop:1068 length:444 start_codon:yes stop_codon:yes gene_type:complete